MGLLRISRILGIVGSIIIIVLGVIATILVVIALAGLVLGFSLTGHAEKYGDLFTLLFVGAFLSGPLPLMVGIGCNRAAFRVLEKPLLVGIAYLGVGAILILFTDNLFYFLAGLLLAPAGILALIGYGLQPSTRQTEPKQSQPEQASDFQTQAEPVTATGSYGGASAVAPQPPTPATPLSPADLQNFRYATDLAQNNQKQEAYRLLKSLEAIYPNNCHLLLWITFTTPYPGEAYRTLETAASLDPFNPGVLQAREWLARSGQPSVAS